MRRGPACTLILIPYVSLIISSYLIGSKSLTFSLLKAAFLVAALFALYSVSVIVYKTTTFHEIPQAGDELLEELAEARRALKARGMKLDSE